MVLPTVRRNTYVKPEGKSYVDIVSKAFVYCELLLGVNRFPIISGNRILVALSYVYSLTANVFVSYTICNISYKGKFVEIMRNSRLIQYEISAVLSLMTWKRFHCFYNEIERFDNEVGCRPKISMTSLKLLLSCGSITLISTCFLPLYRLNFIPLHVITLCEHFYFGYLIDLIVRRMRLLNYYLEYSTSIAKTDSSPEITEFQFFDNDSRRLCFPNMCKMMELYQIIINAHKFLMDAVKWLMLEMIVTSFMYSLFASYSFMVLVEDTNSIRFDLHMGPLLLSYLQLLPPCISSDTLQEEICRFRELLSSSLYENQLDRTNRSTARTLLALTKTCNLSFLLLRVLNISVSLPFSFMGLMVTYLIILLQFKKVLQS